MLTRKPWRALDADRIRTVDGSEGDMKCKAPPVPVTHRPQPPRIVNPSALTQKQDGMLGNEGKIKDAVYLNTLTDRTEKPERGRDASHRRVSTPKYSPTGYDVASG